MVPASRRKAEGMAPRRAAFHILEEVRRGRPFDTARDHALEGLAEVDRRLAHELAAGVLRQQTALDTALALLVPRDWTQVAEPLQTVLRLGAYQLRSLDRVPAHAAVSTGVDLAREVGGARAAGFVNAVLRRLSATPAGGDDDSLARRFSHPEWLVKRWVARFGAAEAEQLLVWNNTRPVLTAQPGPPGLDALRARWQCDGIGFEPAPWEAGLRVPGARPERLPGYGEGAFFVQEPAQALVARFADPVPGVVFDACAAPGGKAIALGQAVGRKGGRVIAGELRGERAARLVENLRRAGSGREFVIVADAAHPPLQYADTVLLDAPCLGTGTFARHPDARWRVTESALARLAAQQAGLLESVAGVVRFGGLLVYATCSLEPEENEQQVEAFLSRHPEFRREASAAVPGELITPAGDLLLLPQRHGTDGAYAARLRRGPG